MINLSPLPLPYLIQCHPIISSHNIEWPIASKEGISLRGRKSFQWQISRNFSLYIYYFPPTSDIISTQPQILFPPTSDNIPPPNLRYYFPLTLDIIFSQLLHYFSPENLPPLFQMSGVIGKPATIGKKKKNLRCHNYLHCRLDYQYHLHRCHYRYNPSWSHINIICPLLIMVLCSFHPDDPLNISHTINDIFNVDIVQSTTIIITFATNNVLIKGERAEHCWRLKSSDDNVSEFTNGLTSIVLMVEKMFQVEQLWRQYVWVGQVAGPDTNGQEQKWKGEIASDPGKGS